MSDPLCGPSNAGKSLTNHVDRDRSLQQDRVNAGGVNQPNWSFRSINENPNGANEAFEAFRNQPPPGLLQTPPGLPPPPPGMFPPPPGLLQPPNAPRPQHAVPPYLAAQNRGNNGAPGLPANLAVYPGPARGPWAQQVPNGSMNMVAGPAEGTQGASGVAQFGRPAPQVPGWVDQFQNMNIHGATAEGTRGASGMAQRQDAYGFAMGPVNHPPGFHMPPMQMPNQNVFPNFPAQGFNQAPQAFAPAPGPYGVMQGYDHGNPAHHMHQARQDLQYQQYQQFQQAQQAQQAQQFQQAHQQHLHQQMQQARPSVAVNQPSVAANQPQANVNPFLQHGVVLQDLDAAFGDAERLAQLDREAEEAQIEWMREHGPQADAARQAAGPVQEHEWPPIIARMERMADFQDRLRGLGLDPMIVGSLLHRENDIDYILNNQEAIIELMQVERHENELEAQHVRDFIEQYNDDREAAHRAGEAAYQRDEISRRNAQDRELQDAALKILDAVSKEESQKFANSDFFSLMERISSGRVVVDGDRLVKAETGRVVAEVLPEADKENEKPDTKGDPASKDAA